MSAKSEKFIVPVNTIEEERITHRMTPMYMCEDDLYFFNKSTLFRLDYDGIYRTVYLPHADEIILDNNDPIAYLTTYESSALIAKAYDITQEKFLYSHTIPIEPRFINRITVVSSDSGAKIWYSNDANYYHCCSLESKAIARHESIPISIKDGLILDANSYLCFFEDSGVSGSYISIVNIINKKEWKFQAHMVFSALNGRLFIPIDDDISENKNSTDICMLFNDECTVLHVPGIIVESAGNNDFAIFSVFTGDDTEVYMLTLDSTDNYILTLLPMMQGYKTFSPNGNLIYVRGFEQFGSVFETKQIIRGSISITYDSMCNNKSKFIIPKKLNTCSPTIIHFHGGPESFEVPEPRMYGMPQYVMSLGWNWIGVNYCGSLSPLRDLTRSAWKNWRESLSRDIDDALRLTNGDIILAGWSFGAAIALAFASYSPRIKGLLLGGVPGNLQEHMRFACELDPSHESWFNERFNLSDDDGLLFNGISGFTYDVKVMEFHGQLDTNCPIRLANRIAKQWEIAGNPWKRFIFSECGHYPSSHEDVLLFVDEARLFLRHVLD